MVSVRRGTVSVMDDSLEFELNGPPLSEIFAGTWELRMRDDTRVLAWVGVDDGGPHWTPLGKPGADTAPSADWSGVVGAMWLGLVEIARRAPDCGLPAHAIAGMMK
jgi:hypothetical protein